DLPNPVIRSHFGHGFIKQYVRDHRLLRTEPATNNVADYAVPKAIDHLPLLRRKLAAIVDSYLDVQQDILETFVDRGQLRTLSQPTILPTGKRARGLNLPPPRTVAALDASPEAYRLASLRYELSKLRAKGLVERLPHSRRYRLRPEGYRICLVFLKLFERIYAPRRAGLLRPVSADTRLQGHRVSELDKLYQRVVEALDRLLQAVGLNAA